MYLIDKIEHPVEDCRIQVFLKQAAKCRKHHKSSQIVRVILLTFPYLSPLMHITLPCLGLTNDKLIWVYKDCVKMLKQLPIENKGIVIMLFYFNLILTQFTVVSCTVSVTYHGGFSNGAKAVDENVAGNIDWRTYSGIEIE